MPNSKRFRVPVFTFDENEELHAESKLTPLEVATDRYLATACGSEEARVAAADVLSLIRGGLVVESKL